MSLAMTNHNYCILLAGGVGKRLWPVSRERKPKQFIDFFGIGKTLLQLTFERFAAFLPVEHIFVSTFTPYVDTVREQLPQLPPQNILAEPTQLSTAPAAAWATWHIARFDPEACIVATPADQFITGENLFAREITAGLEFVSSHNTFLAMSVAAHAPNTAYGYIQKGEELGNQRFSLKTFTEKPPLDFARQFVASGEFLWNTGLFLWNARTMLPLVGQLIPGLPAADAPLPESESESSLLSQCYPAAEHCSLDHVVLNNGLPTVVQACTFGWKDVGSWPVMKETLPANVDGNTTIGSNEVLFQGTRQTLVSLPKGYGAVIRGLDGYLVTLQDNMLLITPNEDASRTRLIAGEVQMKLGENFL